MLFCVLLSLCSLFNFNYVLNVFKIRHSYVIHVRVISHKHLFFCRNSLTREMKISVIIRVVELLL